jgi:transcriptional regulator with XRE-family HTH domain
MLIASNATDERQEITGSGQVRSARPRAALRREWTQEDLAERSGLNVVQISHLEGGRNEAKISTILRLAKAFGITPSKLLKLFG